MKVITLTQPWAQLIALGAKRIETRGWGTRYRGDIAIHAAKGLDPVGGPIGLLEQCSVPPYAEALAAAGIQPGELPRAHVVAVARLAACTQMTPASVERVAAETPAEHAFGDYRPGRWAWTLVDIRPLRSPYPLRGALGLTDVPASQAEEIMRLAIHPETVRS